jgi:hypothetical protein
MPQAHETETVAAQSFEEHRRFLLSLAYRMLVQRAPANGAAMASSEA